MDTIDLLKNLYAYEVLLDDLRKFEAKAVGEDITKLVKTITLSYSRITAELIDTREDYPYVGIEFDYDIKNTSWNFLSVHCRQKAREQEIQKFIVDYKASKSNESTYSSETSQYLTAADAIAKTTVNCSSGDNYYPGYFSKIILEESKIVLEQINRHNARSSDHRDDYFLRDLVFTIPLTSVDPERNHFDEQLGKSWLPLFIRLAWTRSPAEYILLAASIGNRQAKAHCSRFKERKINAKFQEPCF